jgi:predicted nucleic acid-binding protein
LTAFFDTNVVVYAFTGDRRAAVARQVMAEGGAISVQVLSEFTNVARRKLRMPWDALADAVDILRARFDPIVPVTVEIHTNALALAGEHRLDIFDAQILAAALAAGCDVLLSEDLQSGRRFGDLTIRNPFAGAAR